jgi:hypothetical protein
MTRIIGHDRFQTLLLPESLDDYVGPDNPVRFIEAFVEGLDLATADFTRVKSKETSRPGYAPANLLKLYIWLPQPDPIQPRAGSRGPSQYRGDLVAAASQARFQDDCRLPPR